jgi:hypothetical protein
MDTLVERLDAKLRVWQPTMANQVRQRIAEIIEVADQDALDILRSRVVEEEVLETVDDDLVGSPVHPSIPQGERTRKSVSV